MKDLYCMGQLRIYRWIFIKYPPPRQPFDLARVAVRSAASDPFWTQFLKRSSSCRNFRFVAKSKRWIRSFLKQRSSFRNNLLVAEFFSSSFCNIGIFTEFFFATNVVLQETFCNKGRVAERGGGGRSNSPPASAAATSSLIWASAFCSGSARRGSGEGRADGGGRRGSAQADGGGRRSRGGGRPVTACVRSRGRLTTD
ncbi:hypothetical protein D1007_13091 [Hordeum vulgare]|nr:hypothetical protein D1007_13091 [Hordeum vulgare]